jgi:DNA-binding phage protein
MEHESRYEKFDVVDYLTCEEAFREYIIAHIEDGADEDEVEDAYRDIERARIVHNIPEPVASVGV